MLTSPPTGRIVLGQLCPKSSIFNIGKSKAQLFDKDTSVSITFNDVAGLEEAKVEVMEIPSLSYHYLCRLRPVVLLHEERITAGHHAGRGRPCDPIAWADIKAGAEAKQVDWADVVDFYARHSCDEYNFYRGYRFRDREGPLPAYRK